MKAKEFSPKELYDKGCKRLAFRKACPFNPIHRRIYGIDYPSGSFVHLLK